MEALKNLFIILCIILALRLLSSCSSQPSITNKEFYIQGCIEGQVFMFMYATKRRPDYKFLEFTAQTCTELSKEIKLIEAEKDKAFL